MTKQTTLSNEVSRLNHKLDAKLYEALETSGEVLAASARWCRENGVSALEAKSAIGRIKTTIDSIGETQARANIAHQAQQNVFEEKMDGAFECPPTGEAVEPVKLKTVA